MKYLTVLCLFIIFLICLLSCCNAQPIGTFSAGFASNRYIIGHLGVGAKKDHFNATVNVSAFAVNKRDVPSIFDLRIGYEFKGFEIFAGPAYHYAGENIPLDEKDPLTGYAAYNTEVYKPNPANGVKPGFGLVKHFTVVTIGFYQSGNISSIQLGLKSK